MEYKIISAQTTAGLANNITGKLKEGWEPVGGILFNPQTNKFIQAIIKRT